MRNLGSFERYIPPTDADGEPLPVEEHERIYAVLRDSEEQDLRLVVKEEIAAYMKRKRTAA